MLQPHSGVRSAILDGKISNYTSIFGDVIGADSLRLIHLGAKFLFLWQAMKVSRKHCLSNRLS